MVISISRHSLRQANKKIKHFVYDIREQVHATPHQLLGPLEMGCTNKVLLSFLPFLLGMCLVCVKVNQRHGVLLLYLHQYVASQRNLESSLEEECNFLLYSIGIKSCTFHHISFKSIGCSSCTLFCTCPAPVPGQVQESVQQIILPFCPILYRDLA